MRPSLPVDPSRQAVGMAQSNVTALAESFMDKEDSTKSRFYHTTFFDPSRRRTLNARTSSCTARRMSAKGKQLHIVVCSSTDAFYCRWGDFLEM